MSMLSHEIIIRINTILEIKNSSGVSRLGLDTPLWFGAVL